MKTYMDVPLVKKKLEALNDDVLHLTAYINVKKDTVKPKPLILRWKDLLPLIEAVEKSGGSEGKSAGGKLITLCNKTTGSWQGTIPTLLAELRILAPLQHTKAHRHTPAAIQYTIAGRGYSVIEGKRYDWEKGDIVIYPAWSMHELCNTETTAAILMNVLDVPLVELMGHFEIEDYPDGHQNIRSGDPSTSENLAAQSKCEDSSAWQDIKKKIRSFENKTPGLGVLTYADAIERSSPVEPLVVRWKELRRIFEDILNAGPPQAPRAGEVIFLYNKTTGDLRGMTPTMSGGFQILRPGARGTAHSHRAANILYIIEGKGYIIIDGTRYNYEEGDIVAFPGIFMHEQGNRDPEKPCIFYGASDLALTESMRIEQVKTLTEKYQQVVTYK